MNLWWGCVYYYGYGFFVGVFGGVVCCDGVFCFVVFCVGLKFEVGDFVVVFDGYGLVVYFDLCYVYVV